MRRRRQRGRSKRTYLAVLVVVSLAALLLPDEWTGKLISIAQVIVPFQHATTAAVDSISHSLQSDGSPVPAQEHATLQRRNTALEHQIAALSSRVRELEREVDILTATRLWDVDGSRIGACGRLIPARVITKDLLPWRSSRLINAGSLQGVRPGSPVVSNLFTIDQGQNAGVRSGMTILLRETVVGVVEQVGTHTARVKLLSDVDTAMKVRIGRFTDRGFVPVERYFWLNGRGGGRMEIRDAKRREVEAGLLQPGDTVLSDPTSGALPAAMTIGRITAIQPDRDNPLLAILTVASVVDEESLRRVYVFDPEAPPADGARPAPQAGE